MFFRKPVPRGAGSIPSWPESLEDALHQFPVHEVYQGAGFNETSIAILAAECQRKARRLGEESIARTHPALPGALVELVRFVFDTFRSGANNDHPLYPRLRLAAKAESASDFVLRCNRWAESTRETSHTSRSMLTGLLEACQELEPARPILFDLLARTTNLLYVPLVVRDVGIAVPVEVSADYGGEGSAPFFHRLGEADSCFPASRLQADFVESS